MGRRSEQGNLFSVDSQYLDHVGRGSLYGFLAMHGHELFDDDGFAAFYCHDNGRTSVPPSLLAIALLLQTYDRVSDAEAIRRTCFDLQWKAALGLEIEEGLCAKSTLQEFRAQLVIHEESQAIFRRSLEYAKRQGYLKKQSLRVALDSTVIFGRGAVKDTYNLIGDGIRILCQALASAADLGAEVWAHNHEYSRYFGTSLKGEAEVDWDDKASREAFLIEIIADGTRLLALAKEWRSQAVEDGAEDEGIVESAVLLSRLLWQDVEPTDDGGFRIKKGTVEDRIPSAHDPEQRHGRKSHAGTFTGYKASVAVETETGLVTSVGVIGGNASDGDHAPDLVTETESNAGCAVGQVLGDTAYGSMAVRESLGDREVIAPTVKPTHGHTISKGDFEVSPDEDCVVCPEGQATRQYSWVKVVYAGEQVRVKRFAFDKTICRACPRSAECIGRDKRRRGRFVQLHPRETALRAAREFERTAYHRSQYRSRVVVEHRIARLVQLGIRQSRYVGLAKTAFQVLMAATVANLVLVMPGGAGNGDSEGLTVALLALLWAFLGLSSAILALSCCATGIGGAPWRRTIIRRPPVRIASARVLIPAFGPGF